MWSATPAPFAGCRSWVSAGRQALAAMAAHSAAGQGAPALQRGPAAPGGRAEWRDAVPSGSGGLPPACLLPALRGGGGPCGPRCPRVILPRRAGPGRRPPPSPRAASASRGSSPAGSAGPAPPAGLGQRSPRRPSAGGSPARLLGLGPQPAGVGSGAGRAGCGSARAPRRAALPASSFFAKAPSSSASCLLANC